MALVKDEVEPHYWITEYDLKWMRIENFISKGCIQLKLYAIQYQKSWSPDIIEKINKAIHKTDSFSLHNDLSGKVYDPHNFFKGEETTLDCLAKIIEDAKAGPLE
jgi:hypothetical protein